MRHAGDIGLLEARRTDVEVELAVEATDARVRDPTSFGSGSDRVGGASPDLGWSEEPEGMLDVGDGHALRRDRACHLGRFVDQQVGPPCRDDPIEVVKHGLHPHAAEQPWVDVPHPIPRRHVPESGCHLGESSARDRHVQAGGKGFEPESAHVAHESRIRRERHLVACGIERLCEGDHGVEMSDADHAGEQDSHAMRLPDRRTRRVQPIAPEAVKAPATRLQCASRGSPSA